MAPNITDVVTDAITAELRKNDVETDVVTDVTNDVTNIVISVIEKKMLRVHFDTNVCIRDIRLELFKHNDSETTVLYGESQSIHE